MIVQLRSFHGRVRREDTLDNDEVVRLRLSNGLVINFRESAEGFLEVQGHDSLGLQFRAANSFDVFRSGPT